jgi:hypothetical protein
MWVVFWSGSLWSLIMWVIHRSGTLGSPIMWVIHRSGTLWSPIMWVILWSGTLWSLIMWVIHRSGMKVIWYYVKRELENEDKLSQRKVSTFSEVSTSEYYPHCWTPERATSEYYPQSTYSFSGTPVTCYQLNFGN